MRRSARMGVALALPLVVIAAWSFFGRAGADSPTTAGWWTSANPGLPSLPVSSPVPGGGPDGLPSDVPAGGLEVSSVAGQTSYAALGYYDLSGAPVENLVLTVDSKAATLPNSAVKACPLAGSGTFSPAGGGPTSQGPKYDCSVSVAGKPDPAAGTVAFAVGGWVRNGYLGVAIVADGTGRTVFDPPGHTAIALAGVDSSASTAAVPVDSVPSQPVAVPQTTAGSAPAPVTGAPVAPVAPAAPVAAGDTGSSPQLAPPAASAAPRTTSPAALPATLAATEHPYTVGTGGALAGGLLIIAGAGYVAVRNRRPIPSQQEADRD